MLKYCSLFKSGSVGSVALNIPKAILTEMGLKAGDTVEVETTVEEKEIKMTVRTIRKRRFL